MKRRVVAAMFLVQLAVVLGAACAPETTALATEPGEDRAATAPASEDTQVKLGEKQQEPEARRKDAIERARQYLSKIAKVEQDEISLESATETTWPDASLGCPEKDRMYAQVVTEGFKVILRARGATHELHVGRGRVVQCMEKSVQR